MTWKEKAQFHAVKRRKHAVSRVVAPRDAIVIPTANGKHHRGTKRDTAYNSKETSATPIQSSVVKTPAPKKATTGATATTSATAPHRSVAPIQPITTAEITTRKTHATPNRDVTGTPNTAQASAKATTTMEEAVAIHIQTARTALRTQNVAGETTPATMATMWKKFQIQELALANSTGTVIQEVTASIVQTTTTAHAMTDQEQM